MRHCSAMTTTIRLEKKISTPTTRETELKAALSNLPEVNVECIPGWSEHVYACARLAAAEAFLRDAEESMRETTNRMRKYIAENWKPSEIPSEVKSMLNVW